MTVFEVLDALDRLALHLTYDPRADRLHVRATGEAGIPSAVMAAGREHLGRG